MAVLLTGPESLFVRLGHIFGTIELVNEHRGNDIPPHIDIMDADFQTTDQNIINGVYGNLLSYQNSVSVLPASLRTVAQNILTQMVNEDIKQTSLQSVPVCMNTLIDQMNDASASVKSCAVSTSFSSYPENNGNPNIVIGTKNSFGLVMENAFAELIRAEVVSDSQTNGVTQGRESINFQGQYAIPDPLSWLYPAGSQGSLTIACVDPSQDQGQGTSNHLNNSDFETWTATDVPDFWNIYTGAAITNIKRSSTVFYDGLYSLELVGDDATQTTLYQQFATRSETGDTSSIIASLTQFAINAWVKVDVVPAQGVLEFALVDEDNNIILDEQGTPNSIEVDLTTATTTFEPSDGFFRTPRILPVSIRLRIMLKTALSAGSSVFIDRLGFAQPVSFYQGGPVFAAFSGNENLINGDKFDINISNDYGGSFQQYFDRIFGMKGLNLLLPSSDTPTISDSLIV